jgi:hypothetical protein
LTLRNAVADLTLRALHDARAREALHALARLCEDPQDAAAAHLAPLFSPDLVEPGEHGLRFHPRWSTHVDELCGRIRRADGMLATAQLAPAAAGLAAALGSARGLFDARLYFEVHELLEPYWVGAQGAEREPIQGLIQAAVALEHLANGNLRGARSLLGDAISKLRSRTLAGIVLDPFARDLRGCLEALLDERAGAAFDWALVPPFPWTSPAARSAAAHERC